MGTMTSTAGNWLYLAVQSMSRALVQDVSEGGFPAVSKPLVQYIMFNEEEAYFLVPLQN